MDRVVLPQAQTVVLDHYSGLVDQLLEIFTEFNHSVERTGKFIMGRQDLFKLVASNNAVLIAVLSKLSLLERSDVAWKMPVGWEGRSTRCTKKGEIDYFFISPRLPALW